MSHHPTVDLNHWISVFPLERLRDDEEFKRAQYPAWKDTPRSDLRQLWCHSVISTPKDLAQLEQLREPILDMGLISEGTPVDLFLWQEVPTKPWLTKLGGRPFLPADVSWPKDSLTGEPYTFVAQFCFLDSLDILPFAPPGDILLLFFKSEEPGEDPACSSDDDTIHCEWVKVPDVDPDLAIEYPKISQHVPELYGVRYRGMDFDEMELFDKADCQGGWKLAETQATKIGTSTFFIQGYPDVPNEAALVATLSSLQLGVSETWPLLDVKKAPAAEVRGRASNQWANRELMFGDMGAVYIFLDEHGNTYWKADCY